MNALIENFHLLAAAPNGVAKLRELILGLAITGRLLPQDVNDHSVFPLIEKRRIPRKHPAEKLLEEFSIPNTWAWTSIADLCELRTGATPSTSRPEYFGGEIRWLVSGDIHKQEIYDCEGRITEPGLQNSNCKILPINSVLIALNGQGKTRATVAILRVPAACNQSLVAITPTDENLLLPEFIYLNLRYRYFEIRDITGQKQRRGLNMGLVGDLSISVAPIAEQRRIVAKVDELMRLCDQLEAQQATQGEAHERLVAALLNGLTQSADAQVFADNWARLAEHFELLFDTPESIAKLKQTILQLAVQGKLVPQDPSDEPASELLKKIAAEKARLLKEGKIKKDKPFPEIAEDEKPYALPRGWEWVRLPEIYYSISPSGSKLLSSAIKEEGRVPVVDQGKRYIAGYTDEVSLLIRLPGPVVVFGDHTTERKYVDFDFVAGADGVKILRPLLQDECYFYRQLQSYLLEQRGYARHFKVLNECLYALPPFAEQQRIVAKVDELMRVCDALSERLAQSRELSARLMDTVAARAV